MRLTGRAAALLIALALLCCPLAPARAENRYATLQEVRAYILSRLNRLDGEIEFCYTEALDGMFTDGTAINALFVNYGLAFFRYIIDSASRVVRVFDIQYRQGFKVARLYRNGLESRIEGDERVLLDRALAVAAELQAQGGSDLDLERRIHDRICAMTRYQLSDYAPGDAGFTRYDTAMGVFLYGEAECDGYSDAFYLLCSLTGLEAGFQRGDANGGGHLWNTIRLGGRWLFVDVTWDDPDVDEIGGEYTSYGYFNVSASVLRQDHEWVEEYASCPAEEEMLWSVCPYTWGDGQETVAAYLNGEDALAWIVAHMAAKKAACHYMVDGLLDYESACAALDALMANAAPALREYGVEPAGYGLCLQPMERYGLTALDIGFAYR